MRLIVFADGSDVAQFDAYYGFSMDEIRKESFTLCVLNTFGMIACQLRRLLKCSFPEFFPDFVEDMFNSATRCGFPLFVLVLRRDREG